MECVVEVSWLDVPLLRVGCSLCLTAHKTGIMMMHPCFLQASENACRCMECVVEVFSGLMPRSCGRDSAQSVWWLTEQAL